MTDMVALHSCKFFMWMVPRQNHISRIHKYSIHQTNLTNSPSIVISPSSILFADKFDWLSLGLTGNTFPLKNQRFVSRKAFDMVFLCLIIKVWGSSLSSGTSSWLSAGSSNALLGSSGLFGFRDDHFSTSALRNCKILIYQFICGCQHVLKLICTIFLVNLFSYNNLLTPQVRILKIFVIKKRESKFLNPRSTKYGIYLNQHFMQKFTERNFLPFPALTKTPYEIFANLEKNPGLSPSP